MFYNVPTGADKIIRIPVEMLKYWSGKCHYGCNNSQGQRGEEEALKVKRERERASEIDNFPRSTILWNGIGGRFSEVKIEEMYESTRKEMKCTHTGKAGGD